MSKLVTQRYEYVIYDDVTLTTGPSGVVSQYPTILDQYVADLVQSTGQSYGVANVAGTSVQTVLVPPLATLTCAAPSTNTTNVMLKTSTATPLTPGGTAQTLTWTIMPGQMVTVPGVWLTSATTLTCVGCDTANTANSTAFNLQVMWSL